MIRANRRASDRFRDVVVECITRATPPPREGPLQMDGAMFSS